MHHTFSHTIVGRMDSLGNCPTPDVIFLYALTEGVHINLVARMAEYFVHSSGRTPSSQIHGGQYVTQIAHALGIMTDEVVAGLSLVNEGMYVDIRSLKAMGLIVDTDNGERLKGLNNEVWDPLPPEPANVEDEVMHEHEDEEHEQPPHSPQH
ncbi:hypothetical protein HanRHA438_Chr03g0103311 [Helianthus annuus]|nr:hypothetical protein HanHA89_Chr03g0088301 [Helianthus annuus]KAJ0934076.1 hypothetical protein HanRHA438_Chr03g0103311 [Helianthus annuus]